MGVGVLSSSASELVDTYQGLHTTATSPPPHVNLDSHASFGLQRRGATTRQLWPRTASRCACCWRGETLMRACSSPAAWRAAARRCRPVSVEQAVHAWHWAAHRLCMEMPASYSWHPAIAVSHCVAAGPTVCPQPSSLTWRGPSRLRAPVARRCSGTRSWRCLQVGREQEGKDGALVPCKYGRPAVQSSTPHRYKVMSMCEVTGALRISQHTCIAQLHCLPCSSP